MIHNPDITLTGIDESTDLGSAAFLKAEIGILYSAKGYEAGGFRYPSRSWIAKAVKELPRTSVHICGSMARLQLLEGELTDITPYVQRIQINGVVTYKELEELVNKYPETQIIIQYTEKNDELLNTNLNHSFLVDASGGQGILPNKWNRPNTPKKVGFAGGLGPHNLEKQLPLIKQASANYPWWIDMENSLRINDKFSIAQASKATEIFYKFKQ